MLTATPLSPPSLLPTVTPFPLPFSEEKQAEGYAAATNYLTQQSCSTL